MCIHNNYDYNYCKIHPLHVNDTKFQVHNSVYKSINPITSLSQEQLFLNKFDPKYYLFFGHCFLNVSRRERIVRFPIQISNR